ncbi:MAG: efflux transporter outer membrane subunit [Burkholderiales bacterium]|nr:efflux transporter outer membrane subunit [Burkholderiales bacterium]
MRPSLPGMLVAAMLSACAVTQPVPPKLDLPQGSATAAQNELLEHWWTAFNDPVLDALIDEAFAHNLDIQLSLARIGAARAQVLLAQSYLAPAVGLVGNGARTRISAETSPALPPGAVQTSNNFGLAVQLAYELDVWGKYRSGLLAATNDLAASRYYRETVRIGVAAEVASAYFRLRAADAEAKLLDDTLRLRTETVKLQRDRFEGGIIGEYDLRTAEAERSAVVADIARTQKAILQLESAVATLTGRSPRAVFTPAVTRGAAIDDVTEVPALPSGLPSGLIERRPDIRRSEALMAASDLRIQQARASYFPSLTLTGAYGVESAAMSSLFSGPAGIWNIGLGLVQPLLGLKAIEADVELATTRRDQAIVEYRQTVQVAFREVHDALIANRSARDVLAAETDRRDRITIAFEVAQLRYDAGRTSFLEVIDAQRQLLAAETLRLAAARDAKLSIVDFAKALGGGWDPAQYAAVR